MRTTLFILLVIAFILTRFQPIKSVYHTQLNKAERLMLLLETIYIKKTKDEIRIYDLKLLLIENLYKAIRSYIQEITLNDYG